MGPFKNYITQVKGREGLQKMILDYVGGGRGFEKDDG